MPRFRLTRLIIKFLGVFLALRAWAYGEPMNNPQSLPPVQATQLELQVVPNELLLKLKQGWRERLSREAQGADPGTALFQQLHAQLGVEQLKALLPNTPGFRDQNLSRWFIVTLPADVQPLSATEDQAEIERNRLLSAVRILTEWPETEIAEPNYMLSIFNLPDDPFFYSSNTWGQTNQDLWGLHKIGAPAGWDLSTGSKAVVIASIDSGVDRNHPDIASNLWKNNLEIPQNGIDDDLNGYIDDYYGWDFANQDNDPLDDNGHGTHTAGTIAAIGNNALGVVGMSWGSKIMALKFINSSGLGAVSAAAAALVYAADNGAQISSNSWGCLCFSQLIDDAVAYQHSKGLVVVTAAGNSELDALDFTPASNQLTITVGATDSTDQPTWFTNRGAKIDLVAPGEDILSLRSSVGSLCSSELTVAGLYCRLSGTSMSAPLVSGLAALLLSNNSELTNEQVRQILRRGALDLGAPGRDLDYGFGRVNAGTTLALGHLNPLTPIILSPRSRASLTSPTSVVGGVPGAAFSNYRIDFGKERSPSEWLNLLTSSVQVNQGTLFTINPATILDGTWTLRLAAQDLQGRVYIHEAHDLLVDNVELKISSPWRWITTDPALEIYGTANSKNGIPFSHYVLEWGVGSEPSSWTSIGVALTNAGTQAVQNGLLGTWDTSGLGSLQALTLRLTVYTQFTSESVSSTVTVDSGLARGWPKSIDQTAIISSYHYRPAAVMAALRERADKKIVFASGGQLNVYNFDGSSYGNFPVALSTLGEYFNGRALVVDLDGNNQKEIIVTSQNGVNSNQAKLYVYKSDGSVYPGWPKLVQQDWSYISPAAADIDGDRLPEIVVPDLNFYLHAYRIDGSEATGFPSSFFDPAMTSSYSLASTAAIGDVTGDGRPEIAFAHGNKLHLLDNQGHELLGWPYVASDLQEPSYPGWHPQFFWHRSPSLGDITGDGTQEIIAFAQAYNAYSRGASWHVVRADGSAVAPFPTVPPGANGQYYSFWYTDGYLLGHNNSDHPASIADLNGDGRAEIIAGLNRLFIYYPVSNAFRKLNFPTIAGAALADFGSKGGIGITAGGGVGLTIPGTASAILNQNGGFFWRRSYGPRFLAPMLIADLNADGDFELLGTEWPDSFNQYQGALFLWSIPGTGKSAVKVDWPMYGQNPARTGNAWKPSAPIDSEAPSVVITSPITGATVSGSIGVSVNATDFWGVRKVELLLDGDPVGTDSVFPYVFSLDTNQLTPGDHSLSARAFDASQNAQASIPVVIQVG